MIIPGYLQKLGFLDNDLLSALNGRSYKDQGDHYLTIEPWASLRDVFEYIACLEYSVSRLDLIPANNDFDLSHIMSARYDTASLVFFAQATLDNMAAWLIKTFNLNLKGSRASFYYPDLAQSLSLIDEAFGQCLGEAENFIQRLNSYRMEWLHRVAGGGLVFSDKSPEDLDSNRRILVPRSPFASKNKDGWGEYVRFIEGLKDDFDGEWLVPVGEFAHEIKEQVFTIILNLLDVASRKVD